MRYRLAFISGFGIGYMLGARAGRERYEQIMKLARQAADSPAVQQAAGALQEQALGAAKTAKGKLADRASTARARVGEALQDRVPGMQTRDSNGQPQGRAGHAPGASSDQRNA